MRGGCNDERVIGVLEDSGRQVGEDGVVESRIRVLEDELL